MAIKEKIEQSVKTAYQKYGLKDETRKEFISMIEAEAAKREITEEQEDTFVSEQITAYEFAAKLAQKEAMSRFTPTPIPVPAPAPTPTPPSDAPITLEAMRQMMAEERAAALKPLQDEIAEIKRTKLTEETLTSVRQRLITEAKDGYKTEQAERAWRFATKGMDAASVDPDKLYTEYKGLYEEECSIRGLNGYKSADSTGKNGSDVDLTATKARLEAEGLMPTK